MKKLQIWRPDTCECVVEEEWDPDDLTIGCSFKRAISKCISHINVADTNLYGVLYSNPDGENKRKNLVHKYLIETDSLGFSELKQRDGAQYRDFRDGIDFSWSWS